jgi:hypothetical protein
MKCPKCQTVNSEHRHFCKQCGFRLLNPCLQCGFANEAEDIYCGGCGRSLKETASATSVQTDTAPRPSPSGQSLPPAFLAKILEEERVETPSEMNKVKKMVTQEEIDKLFDT